MADPLPPLGNQNPPMWNGFYFPYTGQAGAGYSGAIPRQPLQPLGGVDIPPTAEPYYGVTQYGGGPQVQINPGSPYYGPYMNELTGGSYPSPGQGAPADPPAYRAPIQGPLSRIPAAQLINGAYAISQGHFLDQTPIGRLFASIGHALEGTLGQHGPAGPNDWRTNAASNQRALPLPSLNYNDTGIPTPNIGPMYSYGPGAFTTPEGRALAGGATPYQRAGAQFSSPAQNALLMASQAFGGTPNSTGTTQDEGHTRFYGGLQRGMIQDGVVVPADPSEQMAGPERRFVNSPALSFWDIISGGGGMVPSAPAPISFSAPPIASLPPLPPGIPGYP